MLGTVRVVVVAVACAAACCGCRPLSSHPLAVAAVEEVRTNGRVAEALGSPVTCDPGVRGVANETDGIAALSFAVKGPKGAGVVTVEGRKTQGTWGVTLLELQPAAGAALALTADIETDTPKFDPAAAAAKPAAPVAPPADIEITLPPPPPGG
jgi:hypothetical protein